MILVIDNYDSFTYNLVQMVGKTAPDIRVIRNQDMSVDEIGTLAPRGIILSPGPGRPEDAGVTVEVIQKLGAVIPILGVCLGHQSIGYAFGAKIVHAPTLMHGLTFQPWPRKRAGIAPVPSVARPPLRHRHWRRLAHASAGHPPINQGAVPT